jgi:hypothetical protein
MGEKMGNLENGEISFKKRVDGMLEGISFFKRREALNSFKRELLTKDENEYLDYKKSELWALVDDEALKEWAYEESQLHTHLPEKEFLSFGRAKRKREREELGLLPWEQRKEPFEEPISDEERIKRARINAERELDNMEKDGPNDWWNDLLNAEKEEAEKE